MFDFTTIVVLCVPNTSAQQRQSRPAKETANQANHKFQRLTRRNFRKFRRENFVLRHLDFFTFSRTHENFVYHFFIFSKKTQNVLVNRRKFRKIVRNFRGLFEKIQKSQKIKFFENFALFRENFALRH